MTRISTVLALLGVSFLSAAASAEDVEIPKGFTSLFNGKDFSNWNVPKGDNGHWTIVSGVIDMRRFSGAIMKGIMEAMAKGPIAGYPCGDIRIVIYDGKMHSVDSNEAAFKTAARRRCAGRMPSSPASPSALCNLLGAYVCVC